MTPAEKIESLMKRREAIRKELLAVERELSKEGDAQHVDALKGHLGGAVKLERMLFFASDKERALDQRTGTLLKVMRTRALVDFGEAGKWRFPFFRLAIVESTLPATEERAS